MGLEKEISNATIVVVCMAFYPTMQLKYQEPAGANGYPCLVLGWKSSQYTLPCIYCKVQLYEEGVEFSVVGDNVFAAVAAICSTLCLFQADLDVRL